MINVMGRILTNLSFFSGVGGLDLGAKMAGGIKTICYCENDRYAQGVLRSRIADGGLDDAPIWDDVKSFDGKPWQGTDIVSGGFPCTDVSVAGKRAGIEVGTRSGLFYELMRVCREVRPRFILLENVAGLLIYPGAHRVFGELASMGFDAGWKIISTSDVGGPILRERIWIIAFPRSIHGTNPPSVMGYGKKKNKNWKKKIRGADWEFDEVGPLRELHPKRLQAISGCSEPPLLRMDGRSTGWVDEIALRLRCCGNIVSPKQSIPAWEEIKRLSDMA